MSDIATITGGSLLSGPNDVTDTTGKAGTTTRFREWWGWFAVAALVLFLIDLGLRLSLAPGRRLPGRATGVRRIMTRTRRRPRRGPPRSPPPSLR